jgi:MFS family permease
MDIAFPSKKYNWVIATAIIVSALGYFVDLYDVYLFNVVRTQSLTSLGVPEKDLLNIGISIIDWTFAGMLIGGVVWGVIGDKKGRMKILFGSIILYSIATFVTSYVENVMQYKLVRLIAGFGLAAELGAGTTLVCELMKPSKRGYGTMLIAAVGMNGIIFASLVAHYFYWRTAYLIGSGMGVLLLILRIGVSESGLFERSLEDPKIKRGNFILLFSKKKLFLKYLKLILIGLPILFISGVMITGAPEFSKQVGMKEIPNAGTAIAVYYACVSCADFFSSGLSQWLKSRKKAIYIALLIQLGAVIGFLYFPAQTLFGFYVRCGVLGAALMPVLLTTTAEQFGTNLRATATTSVPTFIRATFIPLSYIFQLIRPSLGLINSTAIVAVAAILISLLSVYFTKETFGRDLDFYESG